MATMSEEKVQVIGKAIEKITFCKVDKAQIRNLRAIEFIPGTMMRDEDTELYVLRTTTWTIDIVYRLSDDACEAFLRQTPKISIK